MSKITKSENVAVSANPNPITSPAADRNTSYAAYVAQIEANKGGQLKFPISKAITTPFAGIGSKGIGGGDSMFPNNKTASAPAAPAGPDLQRLSNVYRYVAAFNNIDPQQLATGVPQDQLAAKAPVMEGHNFFNDYISGVAAAPITPVTSGPMLGASSQGTGNYLDNTVAPDTTQQQGYAMGGLIGGAPQMQSGPMLSNFAAGGMVGQPAGPAGLAPPMQQGQAPAQPQQPMNPQMFHSQAADLLQQHPEIKQQIQQAVQQAMASGQLTMQEAQLGVQLCQAVVNNPALWPQLRAFAIQNGLATEDQIPQQYDQGLVMAILIAAKAVENPDNGQGVQGRFATGGMIQGPGTGTSDSIPARTETGKEIRVSNGEFIVPKHVVLAKGTDFFNKMIESYNQDGSSASGAK